jgi:hypothetical protein
LSVEIERLKDNSLFPRVGGGVCGRVPAEEDGEALAGEMELGEADAAVARANELAMRDVGIACALLNNDQ